MWYGFFELAADLDCRSIPTKMFHSSQRAGFIHSLTTVQENAKVAIPELPCSDWRMESSGVSGNVRESDSALMLSPLASGVVPEIGDPLLGGVAVGVRLLAGGRAANTCLLLLLPVAIRSGHWPNVFFCWLYEKTHLSKGSRDLKMHTTSDTIFGRSF